jgi:hypothetical protein
MTALEEYTAHHAETAEEIMHRWPWRRFEGMFTRHLLRKAREELRHMRDQRIAALDANMNYDSKENHSAKQEKVKAYQDNYDEGVRILYSAIKPQQEEAPEEEDPLFAPVKRSAIAMRAEATQPLVEQAGMGRQLLGATS